RDPPPAPKKIWGQPRIYSPQRKKGRQRQATKDASDHEEQQCDQHAARAATDGVEGARAAAIGELHTDAETERPYDKRRTQRRDRSAVSLAERGDRRHDKRAYDNDDQTADQTTRITARHETPPGGGIAEFGLEKCNAKSEAAEYQRGRRRRAVEQPQSDQNCSGAERKTEEKPVDANGRAPIGRGQTCRSHENSKARIRNRGLWPSSDRPISCARIQSAGSHCWSTRPSSRRKAWFLCDRAVRAGRTNRSRPNGPYCSSSPPDRPEPNAQSPQVLTSASGGLFADRRIWRCRGSPLRECGHRPATLAPFPCRGRTKPAAHRRAMPRLCLRSLRHRWPARECCCR